MANARKKNVIFVDATGTITVDAANPMLLGVLICPSAAASLVEIKESASGTVVFKVFIERKDSRYVDLVALGGIGLTTAFEISTLTNITSVCLYGNWYKET